MIRVNDDIKEVMNGYNEKEILSKIKKTENEIITLRKQKPTLLIKIII